MSKRELLTIVVLVAGLSVAAADDDRIIIMLHSNGEPGYGMSIDIEDFTVADDFEVNTGAYPLNLASFTLRDVGCGFPASWDGLTRWWVHVDDGSGRPGTVIATGWAPWVDWSAGPDDCATLGSRYFQVWFPLGREVDLVSGVRYWLAMHMSDDWVEDPGPQIHVSDAVTPYWSSAVFRRSATGAWETTWDNDIAFAVKFDTSLSYVFYDGFESSDVTVWSAGIP